MTWLWLILIVAAIGGIIGFFSSNRDEDRGSNAVQGALGAGVGCGMIIFQVFLWGLGIAFMIWLFGLLFG